MKGRNIVLSALVAMLAGCATGYTPHGFKGGYSDRQLGDNVFQVQFSGNAMISASRVDDYTLLRSAEVALENGFNYFVIVDENAYETSGSVYTPATTYATATTVGSSSYGSATTYGGYSTSYSKPSNKNTIMCFVEKPPGFSYSAIDVAQSLKSSYGLD